MTHQQYRSIRDQFAPVYAALEARINDAATPMSWTEVECLWSIMVAVEDYYETAAMSASREG